MKLNHFDSPSDIRDISGLKYRIKVLQFGIKIHLDCGLSVKYSLSLIVMQHEKTESSSLKCYGVPLHWGKRSLDFSPGWNILYIPSSAPVCFDSKTWAPHRELEPRRMREKYWAALLFFVRHTRCLQGEPKGLGQVKYPGNASNTCRAQLQETLPGETGKAEGGNAWLPSSSVVDPPLCRKVKHQWASVTAVLSKPPSQQWPWCLLWGLATAVLVKDLNVWKAHPCTLLTRDESFV